MKFIQPVFLLPLVLCLTLWSASPVPYTGKIDIRGVNYFGDAQFTFSLHDGNGTTHWRNAKQPGETIKVTIRNGRYSVLLGGQGMNSLPPELFLNHDKLYLKVEFDNEDGEGLRHLGPDQLITATPRALVAEVAKVAQVAEKVGNGAITRDMLSSEVLSQLDANATTSPTAPITITRDMLPQDVRDDLNKTVTITRSMLPADVLSDLNRTISKSMLGSDVLADLNKSSSSSLPITLSMLAPEVKAQINASIYNYGDLKYSFQNTDHSGWIKLDGRSVLTLKDSQILRATALGFDSNIPDAKGSILMQNDQPLGQITGDNNFTIAKENLPLVDFNGTTDVSGSHNHKFSFKSKANAGTIYSEVNGGTSGGGSWGQYTTTSAGAHDHNVTVSSGGSGIPINITPKSLSANTFIYLGD